MCVSEAHVTINGVLPHSSLPSPPPPSSLRKTCWGASRPSTLLAAPFCSKKTFMINRFLAVILFEIAAPSSSLLVLPLPPPQNTFRSRAWRCLLKSESGRFDKVSAEVLTWRERVCVYVCVYLCVCVWEGEMGAIWNSEEWQLCEVGACRLHTC